MVARRGNRVAPGLKGSGLRTLENDRDGELAIMAKQELTSAELLRERVTHCCAVLTHD
jgi:hypothetical protein